jgi:hypothetical protein
MAITRFHGDRQIEDGTIDKDDLNTSLKDEIDAKVVGPASSTDNAIARFDSTTGKLLQNSTATLNDSGIMTLETVYAKSSVPEFPGIFADVIAEHTAGSGVAIDGVLLKDGEVDGKNMDDVVEGPASATDNAITLFSGTTGKLIKESQITVSEISPGDFSSLQATQVRTGSIAEATAGSGVNIDGVLLKDGEVDGVKLKDGNIADTNGNTLVGLNTTASAVNNIEVENGATGSAPAIYADGTDTNINLFMRGKGSGSVIMADGSANSVIHATGGASSVNYTEIKAATTGNPVQITAQGTDTNVGIQLVPKGSGGVTGITKSDVGLSNVPNTDATARANHTGTQTASTISDLSSVVLNAVYPVGILVELTVSTNPGTLFGIGTWAAHGTGRVTVGKAASGTFGTAGATGGAETHTLSVSELPAWNLSLATANLTGSNSLFARGNSSNQVANLSVGSGGGGGSHNNLQPYVVVYRWERTA